MDDSSLFGAKRELTNLIRRFAFDPGIPELSLRGRSVAAGDSNVHSGPSVAANAKTELFDALSHRLSGMESVPRVRLSKACIEIMEIEFDGEVWYWKGPAPHYFVTVPTKQAQDLKDIEGLVTYGWGMIPATVRIGKTEWTTSLFPKDGSYIVPLKAVVRTAEKIEEGDIVTVRLDVDLGRAR
jgi:hypothetical protein